MNRLVSLLPAATEIVAALGASDELVGISHECDFPEELGHLPRITTTPIDPNLPGGEIDRAVRALVANGKPVIAIEASRLLELQPTHLITQELCEVCAVADGEAFRLAQLLDPAPTVVNLGGRTLEGVWGSMRQVAEAIGRAEAGRALVERLEGKVAEMSRSTVTPRPRVLCVEWLEPVFTAGHWVPEMVAAAGGDDVGAKAGDHSAVRSWPELRSLGADIVIIMLCGMGVERSERELASLTDRDALALLSGTPTWVLDGNAYTSRPGPRLVDGIERIAAALRTAPMSGLAPWGRLR